MSDNVLVRNENMGGMAQVDAETAEQFAERMVGAIDSASLAILISIGHQTGLFDAMADLPPSTSAISPK